MTTMLVALAALCILALFLAERGVPSSATPLAAVCATLLYFTLAGCLGLLRPAGWVFYGLVLAALCWLVARGVLHKGLPRPGYGFWLFLAGGVGFILLLGLRQPMFTTWDEFSFWGTASKLTKLYNEFYVTAPVGWPWPATQTPALISFNYFCQFWARSFSEWQTYAAADILMLAAFAALLVPFEKRHWGIALPVGLTALLVPYMFAHYASPQTISPVYLDSLADVPMGVLSGAALCLCLGAQSRRVKDLLPVYLALAALTLMKDNIGLALALVVCLVLFAGLLFAPPPPSKNPKGLLRQNGLAALGRLGLGVGSVAAAYLAWSIYTAVAANVDRTNLGGKENISILQVPFRFIADLFSSQKSETFLAITGGMPAKFVWDGVSLFPFGSGLVVMLVVLAMVGFAWFTGREKAQRRRCAVYAAASTLGFAAYYLLITLSYLYIFRDDQLFASYERYMYPYYIGWFMGALVLLGQSAKTSRFVATGRLAVLAVCAFFCLRVYTAVPPAYSVLGFNGSEYNARREFQAHADALAERLDPAGKTFILIENASSEWFEYCYALLPYQVDYSYGGGAADGRLMDNQIQPDGATVPVEVTAEALAARLVESGCTTLYIHSAGPGYVEKYGGLFSDGMAAYLAGETSLYAVTMVNGSLVLAPMKG